MIDRPEQRKTSHKIISYIITIIGALIILIPLLWMLSTSFKTFPETMQNPPTILPKDASLDSYREVLEKLPMGRLTINTIIAMVMAVILALVLCSLAGFSLAFLDPPGGRLFLILIISLSMVPGEVLILPVYNIMNKLGLVNTLAAIYIPHGLYTLGVLLCLQAFKSIPQSYIESARIDGSGWIRIYTNIAMPLIRSTLTSLAIIVSLGVWKELLWVIVVNQNLNSMTLGPGISRLSGEHITRYNQVMAADVLAIIPMLVIFFLLQKQFIKSVTDSGID